MSGELCVLLRPLTPEDEDEARRAHAELAEEGFEFLLGLRDGEPWADHLARLERLRRGIDRPPDRVPATFLVAQQGRDLVGRVSVRHELNAWLAELGGHIGYAVRPAFRRRGVATELLRQALLVARGVGIDRALLVCDLDNTASAAVIERGGGVLEGIVEPSDGSGARRRYWIATS